MFKIRVPATSANLGPGFDTLGIALNLFLEVEIADSIGTEAVEYTGEEKELIVHQDQGNLFTVAMNYVFRQLQVAPPACHIKIHNSIPVGKGLGSSAAAIVAGVFAADHMLAADTGIDRLIHWAAEIEGHADNVVPAALGGLTTVLEDTGRLYYQKVPWPSTLKMVVVVPDFVMDTKYARSLLPQQVSLKAAKANLQRACYLLASLVKGDVNHLRQATEDHIALTVRKNCIPGFDTLVQEGLAAGAAGITVSGAGPSILAICKEHEKAVGTAIQEVFAGEGITSTIYILHCTDIGVQCIEDDKE